MALEGAVWVSTDADTCLYVHACVLTPDFVVAAAQSLKQRQGHIQL